MVKIALLAFVVAAFFLLISRPGPAWALMDVGGHLPDLQFSLTSDTGQTVTAQGYKGDIVILYFGFAGCSVQCPATLGKLAAALTAAGVAADHVHVLFVTVDPVHDTPAALHHFLSAFDARHMTGLTGTPDDLRALAKRYRTLWQPAAHSQTLYIFDSKGHARLLATPADSGTDLLHDIRLLEGQT
jgi:protein SCO1/2